jgi:hypothetical protein
VAASLVALSLGAVLTISVAGAAGAKATTPNSISDQPKVYQPSGHGTALAHGVVDMATLPTIAPHAVTTVQTPPLPAPDALTPAQRQAYNDKARATTPTTIPGSQPASPSSNAPSPRFVGGGSVPLLVKQFDGISSRRAARPATQPSPPT